MTAKLSKKKARKRRRLENRHTRKNQEVGNYRSVHLRASTVNEDSRSVEVVLATEAPVLEFDFEQMRAVPHVLLMSGLDMPSNRQVPLLESHQRFSTESQLGSIRDLQVAEGELVGRAFFSKVAEDEWTKVREGHITDVSIGYRALEIARIRDGVTERINGEEYTGPVNVITKSRVFEGSAVPVGADELAKMRGLDPSAVLAPKELFTMDEKLRQLLIERGMPSEKSDDEAQVWLVENRERVLAPAAAPQVTAPVVPDNKRQESAEDIAKGVLDILDGRDQTRAAFIAEVDATVDLVEGDEALKVTCRSCKDLNEVRGKIGEWQEEQQTAFPGDRSMTFGPSQVDKFREQAGTSLSLRCMQNASQRTESIDEVFPVEERSKDAGQFRNHSLLRIAEECLIADGFDPRRIRGLTRENLAIAAMGWPEKAGFHQRDAAYHTTGSFTVLTQDAVNKSMQLGYVESPQTWQGPMRQGASVPDFKTIHRMRSGAIPELPVWPDNEDPNKASFRDAEETYAVEARSLEIGFSYRLLVNDDMDALSRVPAQAGDAAGRTVNTVAWAEVTGNPTMEDSQALFLASPTGNRFRANLTTGAGAPSVTTVQTLTSLMMLMRGENTEVGGSQAESDDILALEPAYIIGPTALRTTILQLINSTADPALTGSSAIHNPTRNLIPVIEPRLDADSATAWYLFASPTRIDTVEVSFLQGQESPQVRDWVDDRTLSHNWTVLQTFAAKAMNHRGVQRHDGT